MRWAVIALIRAAILLIGYALSTRHADWRQLVGYPLLLIGALPDAAWVSHLMTPRSPKWIFAELISLALSSALIAAISIASSLKHRAAL